MQMTSDRTGLQVSHPLKEGVTNETRVVSQEDRSLGKTLKPRPWAEVPVQTWSDNDGVLRVD